MCTPWASAQQSSLGVRVKAAAQHCRVRTTQGQSHPSISYPKLAFHLWGVFNCDVLFWSSFIILDILIYVLYIF